MTDAELATCAVTVGRIESTVRAHWDAVAGAEDADEYQAAMGAARQAGALRRSLEQWIVTRATHAQRAAGAR